MNQETYRNSPDLDFGVVVAQYGLTYDQVRRVAIEAEKLGFDSVWLYDHLFWDTHEPLLECWTTLSSLAVEISKPRMGTLVTCYSYRQPSLLAKMSATFDNLSGGRLILGLGSGVNLAYHEREVRSYGFPFPESAVRIDQLREYIQIVRQMWTGDEVKYHGTYYKLDGAVCLPKPLQKPCPPVIVAGSGNKCLRLAVDLADEYNYWGSLEEFEKRIRTLDSLCAASGRNPTSLRKSWHISGVIDKDSERVRNRLDYHQRRDVIKEPRFGGSPEEWTKLLSDYIRIGVTGFQIWFLDAVTLAPLRLFAHEVMPKFKHAR